MKPAVLLSAFCWSALCSSTVAAAEPGDPRLREVVYDARAVVTVPVKRGVVTLVVLDADEAITEVAAGLGGDCTKADAAWCIAAQPGGRNLFVKAKSSASAANTLAVVTDRRTHSFRFVVLADGDPKPPVYRLVVKAPARVAPPARLAMRDAAPLMALPVVPPPPPPHQVVAERLQAKPQVMNTQYSIAEGAGSKDIVPTLVYDDGRFTYLRFPGNREVPAVFHVLGDGGETLVNARMEDDLLVVDRVSRRLMLRAGSAVVGLWNEAFDLDGRPPGDGTTVPGVQRVLKADVSGNNAPSDVRKGATP
jgi:type IV secretion system protein VirB9